MLREVAKKYILLTLMVFCMPGRLAAEDLLVGAIRSELEKERKQSLKDRRALATIDLKKLNSDEERGVVLFAQGLQAMEINSNVAAENFDAAKKMFPTNSPLAQLMSIYYGRATVSGRNAKAILNRLKTQVKAAGSSARIWKPEQFSIMIEILMTLKLDSLLATTWMEMETRVKPAMRDEGVAKKIANYLNYRNVDSKNELISIVESLAGGYPHSENGRWAFQKLQRLQCVADDRKNGKEKYIFSMSLINRLASNTNLDEGLKQFLAELTKGRLRDLTGNVKILTPTERVSYLISIRLWNEAKRSVEEDVARFTGSSSVEGRQELGKSLSQLGQIQGKQGEYQAAARTWSLYIELFGKENECRMAYESLADSLARLRVHSAAAKIYENLSKSPSVDPLLKWHHFWNTYLGGDYRAALALLDRAGYVPPRDRLIQGGLNYWRAKILERLKLTDESNVLYRRILIENGDTFYAMLILARKPNLRDADTGNFMTYDLSVGLSGDSEGAAIAGAKGEILTLPEDNVVKAGDVLASANYSSDVRAISALAKWSQVQLGRRLLRHLPTTAALSSTTGWGESLRLAVDLNDYSFGMKSSSRTGSPLKAIPAAAAQIESHMAKHNNEWRDIYPYAFRSILEPIAGLVEIDPFLVLSLMRAESVYTEDARSNVGAQGLMQIMPFTGVRIARLMNDANFQLSELHQPFVNIAYGSYYIKKLSDYYQGNTMLAVAAYNGGPTSVNRWLGEYGNLEADEFIENIPFRETRNYVKSVLRNFNNYKHIWEQKSGLAALPQGALPSKNKNTVDTEIF